MREYIIECVYSTRGNDDKGLLQKFVRLRAYLIYNRIYRGNRGNAAADLFPGRRATHTVHQPFFVSRAFCFGLTPPGATTADGDSHYVYIYIIHTYNVHIYCVMYIRTRCIHNKHISMYNRIYAHNRLYRCMVTTAIPSHVLCVCMTRVFVNFEKSTLTSI